MSELLEGIGSVDMIDGFEGTGLLVRLTKEIDLDDLLIALLANDEVRSYDQRHDDPSTLPGYTFLDRGREAEVGWYRKQPCTCGEEHSWDMALVSSEKPEGKHAYGAFLGVFLG